MSERMMVCENAGKCASNNCFHRKPHIEDTSCAFGCMSHPGYEDLRCLPLTTEIEQPHKPPRKRSAPLYGELLNERELLKMEVHNLRLENENLRKSLTGYWNTGLLILIKLWFRNRKGGRK